jgi:carboxymethylenebutenolidase
MEVQQQIPPEAVKLYDLYIHGEIPRREFMERLNKFTAAGLALPALVEALMPNYAAGQVVAPTDPRIKTSYETVQSPNGNGSIKGLLARPASASATTKLPAILVIHENRGLNPHIEDVARRFAVANFMAFAPDGLTSVGGYPGDDDRGGQMFGRWTAPRWARTCTRRRCG